MVKTEEKRATRVKKESVSLSCSPNKRLSELSFFRAGVWQSAIVKCSYLLARFPARLPLARRLSVSLVDFGVGIFSPKLFVKLFYYN